MMKSKRDTMGLNEPNKEATIIFSNLRNTSISILNSNLQTRSIYFGCRLSWTYRSIYAIV